MRPSTPQFSAKLDHHQFHPAFPQPALYTSLQANVGLEPRTVHQVPQPKEEVTVITKEGDFKPFFPDWMGKTGPAVVKQEKEKIITEPDSRGSLELEWLKKQEQERLINLSEHDRLMSLREQNLVMQMRQQERLIQMKEQERVQQTRDQEEKRLLQEFARLQEQLDKQMRRKKEIADMLERRKQEQSNLVMVNWQKNMNKNTHPIQMMNQPQLHQRVKKEQQVKQEDLRFFADQQKKAMQLADMRAKEEQRRREEDAWLEGARKVAQEMRLEEQRVFEAKELARKKWEQSQKQMLEQKAYEEKVQSWRAKQEEQMEKTRQQIRDLQQQRIANKEQMLIQEEQRRLADQQQRAMENAEQRAREEAMKKKKKEQMKKQNQSNLVMLDWQQNMNKPFEFPVEPENYLEPGMYGEEGQRYVLEGSLDDQRRIYEGIAARKKIEKRKEDAKQREQEMMKEMERKKELERQRMFEEEENKIRMVEEKRREEEERIEEDAWLEEAKKIAMEMRIEEQRMFEEERRLEEERRRLEREEQERQIAEIERRRKEEAQFYINREEKRRMEEERFAQDLPPPPMIGEVDATLVHRGVPRPRPKFGERQVVDKTNQQTNIKDMDQEDNAGWTIEESDRVDYKDKENNFEWNNIDQDNNDYDSVGNGNNDGWNNLDRVSVDEEEVGETGAGDRSWNTLVRTETVVGGADVVPLHRRRRPGLKRLRVPLNKPLFPNFPPQ